MLVKILKKNSCHAISVNVHIEPLSLSAFTVPPALPRGPVHIYKCSDDLNTKSKVILYLFISILI